MLKLLSADSLPPQSNFLFFSLHMFKLTRQHNVFSLIYAAIIVMPKGGGGGGTQGGGGGF